MALFSRLVTVRPGRGALRRLAAIAVMGMTAAAVTNSTAISGAPTLRLGSLLHAHNCYPEGGLWSDRLQRALAIRGGPIAIEQDLVWVADAEGRGRSVLAHRTKVTGDEPTLESYFFETLAPRMREALAAPDPDHWPSVVLHLDFKTNEPEHHRAVWSLLGKYEHWLTTAPKGASDALRRFTPGPLLVLTEDGRGQERIFDEEVPVGGRLRIFGTVPSPFLPGVFHSPQSLIPSGATNYRRWVNFPWAVVELGGQTWAGTWDSADRDRLDALVHRAHGLGLWVRFYTLNGHSAAQAQGWNPWYNFGSLSGVEARWRAAIDAGVDFVATDQYEEFSRVLGPASPVAIGPAPRR